MNVRPNVEKKHSAFGSYQTEINVLEEKKAVKDK